MTMERITVERLEAEVARLTHDLEFVLADYRGFQSVMRGLVERGAVRAEDVRSVEQFLHPILEKEGAAMIAEYDVVELLVDLPDARMEWGDDAPLHAGDRGTVVAVYPDDDTYTVEVMRYGETVALADVTAAQVKVVRRPADRGEG